MSKLFKTLTELHELRTFCSEKLTCGQVERLVMFIDTIARERRDIEEQRKLEKRKHQAKLLRKRKELEAAGFSVEELFPEFKRPKQRDKYAPRPPKYAYIEDGERKTWTGQGRTPKIIRIAVEENGKSLDDFLIS